MALLVAKQGSQILSCGIRFLGAEVGDDVRQGSDADDRDAQAFLEALQGGLAAGDDLLTVQGDHQAGQFGARGVDEGRRLRFWWRRR